ELVSLDSALKAGDNEILIVAKNTGNSPNAAGLIFQASIQLPVGRAWGRPSEKPEASARDTTVNEPALPAQDQTMTIATNEDWQWTTAIPDAKGRFPTPDDASAKDAK